MDMTIMTPPKKGLKTRHYSKDMNMDNNVATLPKKGLKTRRYRMDMNMDNNVATLPKKGLKTRPYNIGMEKSDVKERDHTTHMEKGKPAKRLPKPTRVPPLPPNDGFNFDDDIFQYENTSLG